MKTNAVRSQKSAGHLREKTEIAALCGDTAGPNTALRISPGPWRYRGESREVVDADGRPILCTISTGNFKQRVFNGVAASALPDLYSAAELACLMFKRKNLSTADSDWMGDDEHEAWSALERAMRKVQGEIKAGETK